MAVHINIFQMNIKYSNLFHSKALPNLPKLGFLVLKYMYHLATLKAWLSTYYQRFTFVLTLI
jgi:hypothetical protein